MHSNTISLRYFFPRARILNEIAEFEKMPLNRKTLFENCTNSNENLLSTKVKSSSIVVGIAEKKKEKENRSWQLSIAFILSRPSYAR